MKTTRLTVGIIAIVLALFILLQSLVAGMGIAVENRIGDISEGTGIIVSLLMMIGGIIAVSDRTTKLGTISSLIFFILGGIISIACKGRFKDLFIWGIVSFIFSIIFLISLFTDKKYTE